MSNIQAPHDVIPTIRQISKTDLELTNALSRLMGDKVLGTVVFFDLVGSTGYRRRYGAETALCKTYLHNIAVSESIIDEGGEVVKWLGDGVLGCFELSKCGEEHSTRALTAALNALTKIELVNKQQLLLQRLAVDARGESSDHEIHTKVGICSGTLHFIDLSTAIDGRMNPVSGDEGTDASVGVSTIGQRILDPMGTSVDLAARMSGLAERDSILIDDNTFWEFEPKDVDGKSHGIIKGICKTERSEIHWRRLELENVRETVYVPRVAPFYVTREGLVPSRMTRSSGMPLTATDCLRLAKIEQDQNGHKQSPLVFVNEAVHCNIAGFEKSVNVLAVSRSPNSHPIKNSTYVWSDPHVIKVLDQAELAYRKGVGEARDAFLAVLRVDPRNFHANVRLAMLARSQGDTKTALVHLMNAKESDPHCPLVWAVAGMTHLCDYVNDKNDKQDALTRSITGFARGKKLAAKAFHGLIEQYCTALLAITYYLLNRNEDDRVKGKLLLDELGNWPAKNAVVRYVYRLANVLQKVIEKVPGAQEELQKFVQDFDQDTSVKMESSEIIPYDHVLRLHDIYNLSLRVNLLASLKK